MYRRFGVCVRLCVSKCSRSICLLKITIFCACAAALRNFAVFECIQNWIDTVKNMCIYTLHGVALHLVDLASSYSVCVPESPRQRAQQTAGDPNAVLSLAGLQVQVMMQQRCCDERIAEHCFESERDVCWWNLSCVYLWCLDGGMRVMDSTQRIRGQTLKLYKQIATNSFRKR